MQLKEFAFAGRECLLEIPRLKQDEAHVWLVPWESLKRERDWLLSFLNEEEKGRIGRFRFPEDGERFFHGRAIAKALLACYSGGQAGLELGIGKYGKPYFIADPRLHFNLSHSGAYVLLGFAASPLGVDVEQNSELADLDGLIGHCFTRQEAAYIHTSSRTDTQRRFYRYWTIKEAYLKALGVGLSKEPQAFSVFYDHSGKCYEIRDSQLDSRCTVKEIRIGENYLAAAVIIHH